MSPLQSHFKSSVRSEFFEMFIGKKIGEGTTRQVFEYLPDRDYVIKYEEDGGCFQNVHEMDMWRQSAGHPELSDWLAPCIAISKFGQFLVQAKTVPAQPHQYPERVPSFITDLGRRNFGIYQDRFVAHDYGHSRVFRLGMTKRDRKADWKHA